MTKEDLHLARRSVFLETIAMAAHMFLLVLCYTEWFPSPGVPSMIFFSIFFSLCFSNIYHSAATIHEIRSARRKFGAAGEE